jgi:hypothetical protein
MACSAWWWHVGCAAWHGRRQAAAGRSMVRCSRGTPMGYRAPAREGLGLKLSTRRMDNGEAKAQRCSNGVAALRRKRCYSDDSGRTPEARWCSATRNTGRRDGEPHCPQWPQQKKTIVVVICLLERIGGQWHGQNARRRVPFIAVHCRRAMQACAMEREGGDSSRQ